MITGYANAKASREYMEKLGNALPAGHYSEFLKTRIKLSSIGIGTFPGAIDKSTDTEIAEIISQGLLNGINVIDTASHYRYTHSLTAIGQGIQKALEKGVSREAMFLISKGGFLCFPEGKPDSLPDWFEKEIIAKNLGNYDDLANGIHLLSPEYINYQIDLSRELMQVETLDAFLIDQPEVHIETLGKEKLNQKLGKVFIALEQAVKDNKIKNYGVSAFYGFRVATDDIKFQSITSMLGWAEKAAQQVTGQPTARHHFKIIQFPFNQILNEAFTRFNHATGDGNVASTIQAAYQLGVYTMASHSLHKGHLAAHSVDIVQEKLSDLTPAQRAIQFNRSTPGIGTTLIGLSQLKHLQDILTIAKTEPMDKKSYLAMYQQAE